MPPAAMTTPTTDRNRIRQLLKQWADSTRLNKHADILSNHASDAVIFDVLPPFKYEGTTAYRKSWAEWQPETVGPVVFELRELKITAGQEVGFAHAAIHCGGTHPGGEVFKDKVRATFCLRKIKGRWLITHQHISMPAGTDGE